MNYGNAEIKAMGQAVTLAGKVSQFFWPAIKPSVVKGKFDFRRYNNDSEIMAALRRGFLMEKQEEEIMAGLHIGKVTKEELDGLSIWGRKNLYEVFYSQVFGSYLKFPNHLMPEALDEFAWPVCIPGIISNEVAYQSGKLNIPCWKWTDKPLDEILVLDRGRDAWKHSYIIRVRPNWEADEDLKNISANDIEKEKTNVMMFRERWILGAFIFWLTGEHLDRKTITLTGSRSRVGGVPGVYFDPNTGRVHVYWTLPGYHFGLLRSRQAVS